MPNSTVLLNICCALSFDTLQIGAFCQFPFRWIYYYGSNISTGKETCKTYLCDCPKLLPIFIFCRDVRPISQGIFKGPNLLGIEIVGLNYQESTGGRKSLVLLSIVCPTIYCKVSWTNLDKV